MCGVAPFGSSINSLLDNDTAASRYREVTFRAEEVDLSSRRGCARHPKGGRAGGWSEAAAPEGRPLRAGSEMEVNEPWLRRGAKRSIGTHSVSQLIA